MIELKLRDYQLQQLAYHLSAPRTINRSEPSTGKTPTVCVYMKMKNELEGAKAVFVMPSSLFGKNKEEVMLWCGYSEDEVKILDCGPSKREEIYRDSRVKCFIMSFDCFSSEWNKLPEDVNCVVIDEFHLGYSTHTSKRTQSYYRSSRRFKYYIMMSGTLTDGRYSAAYPAIAVIEPRYYCNYENFIRYHGIFNEYNQIVGWRNPEKLKKILERHSCGITVEEAYRNRKENVILIQKCDMDKAQKEAYLQMEQEALLELEDKFVDARDSGGVKQIRCRQILSCPEAIGLKVKKLGKDESLSIHLEDAVAFKKPLLIFSVFVQEQERLVTLCKNKGLRVGLINGSTPSKERTSIDKKFRGGELDVVIGSPATCSIGFNWEHVDRVIFTSLDYKDSTFYQAIARGNRGTRTTPLMVYILDYGTKVEKRIMSIIKRKSNETKKLA